MIPDTVQESRLPRRAGKSTLSNSLLSVRALQVVLWLLVVSGPLAAVLLALQVSALRDVVEAVASRAAVEVPADTTGVEGFAELFIAAFLGTGEGFPEALAPFMDGVSLDGVVDGSWFATRTASLGAREVSPGYYAVTVAAEVLATDPDSVDQPAWIAVGTRFYSVGVARTESGWVVAGLPSLLAQPPRADPPDRLVDSFDGLKAAPGLGEMVARFIAAYLTGDGELARYTAPGFPIRAVQPPPFQTVEVLRAGSADTGDGLLAVVVVVRATDDAGRAQVLEYSLMVEKRDGRWEVAELLAAPALAP